MPNQNTKMNCATACEQKLLKQGWTRQMMTDEPRLGEVVEEYRALGFEVHLEPLDLKACADSGQCTECFEHSEVADQFKVVYTRPGKAGRRGDG